MPKKKFVSTHIDKHHKGLREAPERLDKHMADVAQRNEVLKATQAYNTRIERDRLLHLSTIAQTRSKSKLQWAM